MIHRTVVACLCAMALPGCSLLFPEDWRVGEEPVADCIARLQAESALIDFRNMSDETGPLVPTYTYDITKLPFERTQDLIQPGADETLGRRLMEQTNMNSTAMEQFLQTPVDEKGAFFFGVEPALWRMRGANQLHGDVLKAGCELQQSDMRLVRVSVERFVPEPEPAEPDAPDQTSDTDQPDETQQ